MFSAISCCLLLGLLRGAAGVRAQSELSSAGFTSSRLRLKDAITSAKTTLAAIRIAQAGEDDADDGEDGDESEDAEQASDLASYLFNATLQKCSQLEVDPGRIDLKSKLREVCAQADAQGLVTKLSERMNDAVVGEWLCGASSKEIEGCKETAESLLGGLREVLEARLSAESLMKFSLYTVKAVATLAPLPPPLGVVLNKAVDLVLNRLSREAEAELEDLESKMELPGYETDLLNCGSSLVFLAEASEPTGRDRGSDHWGHLRGRFQALLLCVPEAGRWLALLMLACGLWQELLRLGAAQARAAEDQIQESTLNFV